jgi:hypothetical protein
MTKIGGKKHVLFIFFIKEMEHYYCDSFYVCDANLPPSICSFKDIHFHQLSQNYQVFRKCFFFCSHSFQAVREGNFDELMVHRPLRNGKRYFGEIHTNSCPKRVDFETRLDDLEKVSFFLFFSFHFSGLFVEFCSSNRFCS